VGGDEESREEVMSEIEELKAKLEQAEQRASQAEGLLAEREQQEKQKAASENVATVTNPSNSEAGERARLAAAAALAARGDRRALLEWATLREELNIARRNE
jgi:hypothetical protein